MDGMSVEAPVTIRVGDHVRWTDPEMDLNVIWEVTKATKKSFYLRCDIERVGKTETERRRAYRDECVLVAQQLPLAVPPLPRAGATT